MDQTRPIGVRDTAIILLGYAGALRRAVLVALTLADLDHQTAGDDDRYPPVPRPTRKQVARSSAPPAVSTRPST